MRTIGKEVYRRASDAESRRNSEGAFLRLKDGRIMHAYSHYVGSGEDWDPSEIAACYSADDGRTWHGEDILLTMEEEGLDRTKKNRGQNLMSVSLLRMRNGDLGMIYFRRSEIFYGDMYLRRSADEGRSFDKPVLCSVPGTRPSTLYGGALNSTARYLTRGRIILPGYYSVGSKSVMICFASDDDGRTWRELPTKCELGIAKSRTGLQEPGIAELDGGLLWAFARTDLCRQYEMFSIDAGETWTNPQPSMEFTSAVAPMSSAAAPFTGGVIAVWNPVPLTFDQDAPMHGSTPALVSKRSPLAIAVSRDHAKTWCEFVDGKSFAKFKVIAPDAPDTMAAYPSIFCTDDAALVAYMGYVKTGIDLVIKRIPFDELFQDVCAGVDNERKAFIKHYSEKGVDIKGLLG